MKKILFIIFSTFMTASLQAKNVDYEVLKQQAIEYENSLTEVEKSQLNQSYAQPLSNSIGFCAQFYQGTSFEIISKVDQNGVMLENWTNTEGTFAECIRMMFNHRQIQSVRNEEFYAILEFNLTKH